MSKKKKLNINSDKIFKKINNFKKVINSLKEKDEKTKKEEIKIIKKLKSSKSQEVKVSLSIESVVKSTFSIALIVLLIYLLFFLKNIIILFLVALFLSAAFNPGVNKLQKYKIPRSLGIILLYLAVLAVVTLIFTSLIPIIANQVSSLANSAVDMVQNIVSGNGDSWFIQKIQPTINQIWENLDQKAILGTVSKELGNIGSTLQGFAGNAVGAIFTVFHGILNLILVLILTFFMILNKKDTNNFFLSLFPKKYEDYINIKISEVGVKIGDWVRGQLLLALSMGVLTFIIFSAIGLNYALTLSMVSALAEFIPYLGPFITFASAALIALNQDPILVLWLIPAYAIIQFLEGNIMVPVIIGKSIGLNPVIILFSVFSGAMIGNEIGGTGLALVGMILSVPTANIISIFVKDYIMRDR